MIITHERLREVLDYDPETGVFTWKVRVSIRCRYVGAIAGCIRRDNYRGIGLDGRTYLAHVLAWFYIHEQWPDGQLDHRNGIEDDNRISNLRPATDRQNKENRHRLRRTNTHGFPGATRSNGRWKAQIQVDGRQRYLGMYDSPEEASAAYLEAKRRFHPFWEGRIAERSTPSSSL